MAPPGGRESVDLRAELLGEPWKFGFFQAVRLLERFAREGGGRFSASVGRDRPEAEAVLFRGSPTLAFQPSAVQDARASRSGPFELTVNMFGLVGASGALPHHYTSLIIQRLRDKDESLRRFLDLFLHRLASLFHRAWEKYRLPFAYERFRSESGLGDDPVTWGLYCLAGMGTGGLRGRLDLPDELVLFHVGHFSHAPRNAASLEAILREYFQLPLVVEQMSPRWLSLDRDDRSSLGRSNHGMKGGIIVGRRVRDLQGKFRIRVGPLRLEEFRRLMPGGDILGPMWQLTRLYVGPDLDFDVLPILRKEDVPGTQLRASAAPAQRARLGYNTWAKTRTPARDAEDAVFRLPG
jgi:type VI secretion system protein ImpH